VSNFSPSRISPESLKSYEAGKKELPQVSFKAKVLKAATETGALAGCEELSEEDKEKLTVAIRPIQSFAKQIFRNMGRYVPVGDSTFNDQGVSFEIQLTRVDDTTSKFIISRQTGEEGFQVRLCQHGAVYKPLEDISNEKQVFRYLGQFETEARCQLYNIMTMQPIRTHLENERRANATRPTRAGRKPFGSESEGCGW
jgi:hypothetical protein